MRHRRGTAGETQLDLFAAEGARRAAPAAAPTAIPASDDVSLGSAMKGFPTIRPAQLADMVLSEPPWMVEGLWSAEAVGIIGGQPKLGKTYLTLDLAIAVASGAPCLRHFEVRRTGTVLLYAAEDSYRILDERLKGIAAAAAVEFRTLDIEIICVPAIRLDRAGDQRMLRDTVARVRPALLSLDPLVRLHAVDENAAGDVAPLLGYLRSLQREFHTSVALVHHARKGTANERAGQALRGSSDLHAWGDSNLYLRRHGKNLYLDIEHRAAPSTDKLPLALVTNPPAVALELVAQANRSPSDRPQPSPKERIEAVLAAAGGPVSGRQLRKEVHMRASDVAELLRQLEAAGRVSRGAGGYGLVAS